MGRYHFVFPRWSNLLLPGALVVGAVTPLYVVLVVAYGFSPKTTDVGYEPAQPVPFSHALHAGELGMDCRYCHNTVERAAKAAIPPTQTCMNCHTQIHKDSPQIAPLLESYQSGNPIAWNRVHDLPDFAFFDHSAHVTRGVSCVSCHGRIDRMEVVYQHEPLSMGWCLECHRNPDEALRDPALVTDLGWTFEGTAEEAAAEQARWKELHQINPSQDCSTCHR
ncbi:MAG: cytochrome c3 family protein [Phycisphaerales bacterium]|nr:cytochrome c family protein [Phycisphaerae bacterium]NNF41643.1 cytochrome c3 family protein [Phycisphaerales bacterium]NNM27564.1 cytochrome c3 family protein [Phycisphaerales bacterium]